MAVLVTSDFAPAHGGIERYMLRLASEMVSLGQETSVVAPWMPGCESFDRTLPYPVIRFPFAGHQQTSASACITQMLRATIAAHRIARDRRTIASSWIRAGVACALLPRFVRGPLAILAHGSEVLTQKSSAKIAIMRNTFARADAVIANSSFTAQIVCRKGVRGNVLVAPCGVEPLHIARRPAQNPTILSVGRLVRRKGFDRTIEAVAMLAPQFPDLRYEIIGTGPDAAYLQDLAQAFGVHERVIFHGRVDDHVLHDAYARAWCFSMPSRAVDGDVEGFGIVYLEAAMCGVPSIGGTGCGAEDAIEHGRSGMLVDGTDVRAVTAALHALLSDPAHAQDFGSYARARALREFTWERTARTVIGALAQREPEISAITGERHEA